MDLLSRGPLQDVRVQFSDLIQASVLKPDLAHTQDHQVAGKAGMVLSFPRKCTPSRSYSNLRLPTEDFFFHNMPFSNEKYFHQKVPHPVFSQTANVNLSFDPQGTRGCVYIKDSLTRLWRGTPSNGFAAPLRIKAATAGNATDHVRGCGTEVGLCTLGSDGFTSVYWLRDPYVASTLPVLDISVCLQGTIYIK